jgi:ubiquinone/menaquinone biosynthesis C-methylase UbiE
MIESSYVSKVFDISCKNSTLGWEAAAWASYESQKKSFIWCEKIIKNFHLSNDTILDVGCGHGDFFEFLNNYQFYTGIDISSEMIKKAKAKYPSGNFILTDVDKYAVQHDWVIALGTFNLDVSTRYSNLHDISQWNYLETCLKHMYRICKKGIVITLLESTQKNIKHNGLFYYDINKTINICKKINDEFKIEHNGSSQFLIHIPLKAS